MIMSYVDGFLLVVPKKERIKYKKIAKQAGEVWKKHGAIAYLECVGDDMNPEWCKLPFPKMAKCKPTEEVWYSFIIFKSKTDRNRINAKVMKDMDVLFPDHKPEDMPFDMERMSYGGFKALVEYWS